MAFRSTRLTAVEITFFCRAMASRMPAPIPVLPDKLPPFTKLDVACPSLRIMLGLSFELRAL